MRRYVTINTEVDVDLYDVIDELDTQVLQEELLKRGCAVPESGIAGWIENVSGCKIYSLTDEDICRFVLREVGRYIH